MHYKKIIGIELFEFYLYQKQREGNILNKKSSNISSPNANIGIFKMNIDGEVINLNQSAIKILGYKPEIDLKNNREEIVASFYLDRQDKDRFLKKIVDNIDVENFEAKIISKNGYEVDSLINASIITDFKGEKIIIGMFEDINEKKMIEKSKIERDIADAIAELKSSFLTNMTHEIKTPISAVIGLSELALKTDLTQKQEDYIEKINESAKSLLVTINDILHYSELEEEKIIIEAKEFNLHEMLRTFKESMELLIKEKSIKLNFDIDMNLPVKVIGDSSMLKQVLINLGNNAVKFTENGSISINVKLNKLAENTAELEFSIEDTGIGISKEQQKYLYQSFHQLDSSISRKFGGTGLGLSISEKIITLLGGKLELESVAGKGSKFYFKVNVEIYNPNKEFIKTVKKEKTYYDAKVLIAEDNIINQQIAKELLEDMGIMVEIASNGLEAVKKVESETFDLILMDIQLPELDGLEATRQIRARGNTIPIIALTAHAMQEDIKKSLAAGMNAHMTKPIDIYILKKNLDKSIGKNKKEIIESKTLLQNDELYIKSIKNKLKELKFIDYEKGLKNTGKNEERYSKLLREFFNINKNIILKIENNIINKNFKDLYIDIHSLKSSAMLLGMSKLSEATHDFDSFIKANIPKSLNIDISNFEFIFTNTINELTLILSKINFKKAEETNEKDLNSNLQNCISKLKTLEDFLKTGNSKSEMIISELQSSFEHLGLETTWKELSDLIIDVEFEAALEILKSLMINLYNMEGNYGD